MAVSLFKAYNGAMPTTAALVKVTTGTAIKTMLQIAPPSSNDITVVGWGISFDGSAGAAGIQCELIETDVAATVTALTSTGIYAINNPGGSASRVQVGTALSGYTASAEGSITAIRIGDEQLIQPTNQYPYEFTLGYEWTVRSGKFARIRVTAPAAVGALCYIAWTE